MMRRFSIVLGLTMLVWLLVGSVQAQASTWTAWLYNRESGQILLVDDSGTVLNRLTLPMLANHDVYSYNVAVSHGGNLIAYTVYSTSVFTTQLLVYDTLTNRIVLSYSPGRIIGDSIDFSGTGNAFSDTDSALAYGYRVEDGGWKISALDLAAGTELFALESGQPLTAAAGVPAAFPYIPVIQRYTGGEVVFTMVASGTDAVPEDETYTWNPVLGTLRPDIAYPTLSNDTFAPTGEVISPMLDTRLANQIAALPIPYQWNSVQVFDPSIDGRYPFYTNPALTISLVYFIQNGERILISAFDINDTTSDDPRFWAVLERDGTLISYMPVPKESRSVEGLYDGFIYTVAPENAADNATSLIHMRTRDNANEGRYIWTGEPGVEYRIVWSGDSRTPDAIAQAALPAWAQLAPPVYEIAGSSSAVSPLSIPTATPFTGRILTIGGTAVVNTTEGDQLNIRSGPGTSFAIVAKVPSGARVTLLEGPRNADGLVWWRLRTPTGDEGWAVESADGVKTLLPA